MGPRPTDERRADRGFTLVELLVVIVILGVLAAVVTFSVGGILDAGQDEACESDVATIRKAEEAHFAQYGLYASEEDLRLVGFLVAPSRLHDVAVEGGGYTITPVAGGRCSGEATAGP